MSILDRLVIHDDCVLCMRSMAESSVDAVVCDPPYGLGFMGKQWDSPGRSFVERRAAVENRFDHIGGNHNPSNSADAARTACSENVKAQAWHETWAREALGVLKPGGYMLAFGGTRTYHRLMVAIEDAGFEIRDCIQWWYGSGFPKSMDVSKAIERESLALRRAWFDDPYGSPMADALGDVRLGLLVERAQAQARHEGNGTALKPAYEPIVLARKPLEKRTVALNVLAYGTGALNIDGCRVEGLVPSTVQGQSAQQGEIFGADQRDQRKFVGDPGGRWPANIILTHHSSCEVTGVRVIKGDPRQTGEGKRGSGFVNVGAERGEGRPNAPVYGDQEDEAWECVPGCPVRLLDEQSGDRSSPWIGNPNTGAKGGRMFGGSDQRDIAKPEYRDAGGASRFFYCAKASTKERSVGLDKRSSHPTVKPVDLMRYLCRLVTPPGGLVLDPFAGSGTTGVAALLEGFRFMGIELNDEYVPIARARIEHTAAHTEKVAA